MECPQNVSADRRQKLSRHAPISVPSEVSCRIEIAYSIENQTARVVFVGTARELWRTVTFREHYKQSIAMKNERCMYN